MRVTNILLMGFSGVLLAACVTSETIAVVGSHALSLRGTLDLTLNRIALKASDGKLTCSGAQKGVFLDNPSIVLDITCSDGRKGVATIESNGNRRHGRLHLDDGTDAEIVTNVAG